jgi:hypothetical protein
VKRWKRILVRVLVVGQLLAAVPLANALPTARADAAPCAGMMDGNSASAEADHCPCCTAGAGSLLDCLAACTLAVAALPDIRLPSRAPVPAFRLDATPSAPLLSLSDPPLKPPPIR